MKEQNSWSQFDIHKKPVGLDPETTFKYGIPYKWGALHVTGQADEAYGFVPLTAGVVKGDGIDTSDSTEVGIRTDIYLLSPKEFDEQAQAGTLPSNPYTGTMGLGATILHKQGIELRLALSQGTEDYKESFLGSIAMFAEQFGGGIDNVINGNGIPITESIGQDSSQALAHYLSALVAETTYEAANEFFTVSSNKKALEKITSLGASGLLGAGLLIGANFLLEGEIDIVLAEMAVAYAGYYAYAARRSIKERLKNINKESKNTLQAASKYANLIADDIHETYCTTHFDQQAEAMLGDDAQAQD